MLYYKQFNICHRVEKNATHSFGTSLGLGRCTKRMLFLRFFMQTIKRFLCYFTKTERLLWCSSAALLIVSFCLFDRVNYATLFASLLGVTSLILNAKGNPIGQVLMIVFSIFYGAISYSCAYYGEMLTYLCMSAPMALVALISWLKYPYHGNKKEVRVNSVSKKEMLLMLLLSLIVTAIFYFILKYFHTANLLPSTISVTTSFIAVYLTAKRSPYYALGYALNDVVLIVLWILAAMSDLSYISVVICFVVFLINDLYGFVNWKKMQKRQER